MSNTPQGDTTPRINRIAAIHLNPMIGINLEETLSITHSVLMDLGYLVSLCAPAGFELTMAHFYRLFEVPGAALAYEIEQLEANRKEKSHD